MSLKIKVKPEAEEDITDAFLWYEEQSPGLGKRFLEDIDTKFSFLETSPFSSSILYKNTRRLLLKRFPYSLFYQIEEKQIVVLSCLHTRRNPIQWPMNQ